MSMSRALTELRPLSSALTRKPTDPGLGGGWTPALWFLASEQGAWYDPSDMSTMFQDSAGTTPVTAVEQPVGKMLDKSGNGNHASQPTTAARPKLSARKNLLVSSEDATGPNWTFINPSGSATRVGNNITFGANALDRITATGAAVTAGGNYVCSVTLSGTGSVRVYIFDGNGSTVGLALVTLSPTPVRYVITHLMAATGTNGGLGVYNNAGGTAGASFTIHNAQYEVGTTATRYQRVNTATSYDEVGFPFYELYDGVDDHVTHPAGGASTAFAIVMGVRPSTVSVAQTLWSDRTGNTGLKLEITAAGNIQISGGNGSAIVTATGAAMAAHTDYVVTAKYDGANLSVQLGNGAETVAACALVAGTSTATIGKDNGAASAPFKGRIYDTIHVKDSLPSDLTPAKEYIAGMMQVTL